MTLYKWSQTASADASADSTINWAEGQSPASVNDSGRAMMAAVAKYRDDIAGAIVTGGTSTAYTVSSYQQFDTAAHMNGQLIAFTPHTTNGAGTVTINVDGLGALALRQFHNVDLGAGVLIQGTPYLAVCNTATGEFNLVNSFGPSPYLIPLGGMIDFIGPTAPNSQFALPFGQAISRTTYATLFSMVGTTYGAGDGTTTFNIPDLRGRVAAGKDDMGGAAASRLTATYFGSGATALGGVGSSGESTVLVTGNLPPYTPAGTITNGAITTPQLGGQSSGAAGGSAVPIVFNPQTITLSQAASSFNGSPQGGTSVPLRTVQPTMIVNKLLRII